MLNRQSYVNVLGQEEDPICTYRNCHHSFSLHGQKSHSEKCNCHHPTNAVVGLTTDVVSLIEELRNSLKEVNE